MEIILQGVPGHAGIDYLHGAEGFQAFSDHLFEHLGPRLILLPQGAAESSGFPLVKWQIEANRLHSALVQEIAQQNPAVCLVDAQPALDGEHEKFIDLVHLTQEGRRQLAEAFFAGIKTKLEEDLARSDGSAYAP
jgi:hypothetical protein